ncbi:MAG TPA: VOC family protein [Thermoanaerobaculia bacterium]|jgi:uncharacterized glyoxalase superfamily protein PhnB
MFKKETPVLIVDAIEPVLPLWQALGFAKTVEVPHGGALGFVALKADDVEIMYQTVESVRSDHKRSLERPFGLAAVFIEVDNLDTVASRIPTSTEVLEPRRKTFYGSTEMILRDAAGHVIIFAQME